MYGSLGLVFHFNVYLSVAISLIARPMMRLIRTMDIIMMNSKMMSLTSITLSPLFVINS